jgi:hypothetical protein
MPPAADGSVLRAGRDGLSQADDSPLGGCVVSIVGGILFVCFLAASLLSTPARRFPAIALSLAVVILSQLLPVARPSMKRPLSPRNWALFIFLIELMGLPVLLVTMGPVRSVLPYLPSDTSINEGMLLQITAYVGLIGGLALLQRLRPDTSISDVVPATATGASLPWWLVAVLGLAGVLGVVLHFGSWPTFWGYVTLDPSAVRALTPKGPATLPAAAATLLVPLLGLATVLIWCRVLDRSPTARRPRWLSWELVLATLGVVIAYSLYSYNRGPAFVAVVSILAAYSLRIRRITYGALLLCALLGLSAALLVGSLRSAIVRPGGIGFATVLSTDVNRQVQVYFNGPQFWGFAIDRAGADGRLYLGGTLVPSILSPVPVLGAPFRLHGGTAIYNRDIYHSAEVADQILPLGAELYWNFWVPGVLFGFMGLGIVIALLDRAFVRSRSLFEAFALQYLGVWTAFLIVGSLTSLSQVALYFLYPMLVLYLYSRWRTRQLKAVAARTTVAGL